MLLNYISNEEQLITHNGFESKNIYGFIRMRAQILYETYEISMLSQACKKSLILSNIISFSCAHWDTASLSLK